MAYASVQNVQEEFKNVTFDSNSAVTDTRVSRYIDEVEAVINSKIGKIYQVPIDPNASPQSFLIVRSLSIQMVSNRIKEILQVKTEVSETDQDSKVYNTKAETWLQEIVDRKTPLPDAVLISSTNGATSFDAGDATVKFAFQRGTGRYGGPNQW